MNPIHYTVSKIRITQINFLIRKQNQLLSLLFLIRKEFAQRIKKLYNIDKILGGKNAVERVIYTGT